ncbi:MAG: GC-type dockerin domain-anchored protein [Phycisphaerales bacterium JB059]
MRACTIISLALISCLGTDANAQSGGPFALEWSTIDSGGSSAMSGGAFTLSGSIGQFDAGSSDAGGYAMEAGFWPVPFLPSEGCNVSDLAEPYGVLDFTDVVAFLGAFGSMDPAADLAPPTGVFDFTDIVAFLGAFGAGCP